MTLRGLARCAALVAAGCTSTVPAHERAEFWTLEDFEHAAPGSGYGYGGQAVDWGGILSDSVITPAGYPLPFLSRPYAAEVAVQSEAGMGLNVFPCYCEGKPAAYAIAEVWTNWPPIWVQPLYLPVTAWDAANPGGKRVEGALPVFAVDEESTFYSPYWIVYFAVVPPETPAADLRTSKAVLDRATELHRGPAKVCSVAPEGLSLAVANGAAGPVHPFTGVEAQTPRVGQAWAEGREVGVLDFGADRFEWDEGGVVEETAMFTLATVGPDGERHPLPVPRVAGVGPLRSGKQAKAPLNRPAFGSLWRLHTAVVPRTAGAFVPSSLPELRQKVRDAGGLLVPDLHPEIQERPDARDYLLRVALDPTCFADPARFPDECRFLDSQAAVEGLLPWDAIRAEATQVNGPLVVHDGAKVPYP